jgi:hypothetical protein
MELKRAEKLANGRRGGIWFEKNERVYKTPPRHDFPGSCNITMEIPPTRCYWVLVCWLWQGM